MDVIEIPGYKATCTASKGVQENQNSAVWKQLHT